MGTERWGRGGAGPGPKGRGGGKKASSPTPPTPTPGPGRAAGAPPGRPLPGGADGTRRGTGRGRAGAPGLLTSAMSCSSRPPAPRPARSCLRRRWARSPSGWPEGGPLGTGRGEAAPAGRTQPPSRPGDPGDCAAAPRPGSSASSPALRRGRPPDVAARAPPLPAAGAGRCGARGGAPLGPPRPRGLLHPLFKRVFVYFRERKRGERGRATRRESSIGCPTPPRPTPGIEPAARAWPRAPTGTPSATSWLVGGAPPRPRRRARVLLRPLAAGSVGLAPTTPPLPAPPLVSVAELSAKSPLHSFPSPNRSSAPGAG